MPAPQGMKAFNFYDPIFSTLRGFLATTRKTQVISVFFVAPDILWGVVFTTQQ